MSFDSVAPGTTIRSARLGAAQLPTTSKISAFSAELDDGDQSQASISEELPAIKTRVRLNVEASTSAEGSAE